MSDLPFPIEDGLQQALDELNADLYDAKPWSPLDPDSGYAALAKTYSTITEAEWRAIDRLVDSLHDGRCREADLERERDQARRLACTANEQLAAIAEQPLRELIEQRGATTLDADAFLLEDDTPIAGIRSYYVIEREEQTS